MVCCSFPRRLADAAGAPARVSSGISCELNTLSGFSQNGYFHVEATICKQKTKSCPVKKIPGAVLTVSCTGDLADFFAGFVHSLQTRRPVPHSRRRAHRAGVRLDGGTVVGEQAVHLVLHIGQLGVYQRREALFQLGQHGLQLQVSCSGRSAPARSSGRAVAVGLAGRLVAGHGPGNAAVFAEGHRRASAGGCAADRNNCAGSAHRPRPGRTSRWPRPPDGCRPASGGPARLFRHRTAPSPSLKGTQQAMQGWQPQRLYRVGQLVGCTPPGRPVLPGSAGCRQPSRPGSGAAAAAAHWSGR